MRLALVTVFVVDFFWHFIEASIQYITFERTSKKIDPERAPYF